MKASPLQEPFLRVFAFGHKATAQRMTRRIAELGIDPDTVKMIDEILNDEMRGLYHGSLVVFDGGSCLADDGLIHIVDEDGITFDLYLHEICLPYYDEAC
jgi:hypothetical protein